MKFEKIIIPPGWQESFTKYPNGKTIFEALSTTITTVNEGIEEVNQKVNQQFLDIDQASNSIRNEITDSFNTLKLQLESEIDMLSDEIIEDFGLLESDVLNLIAGKANTADVYTKQQVDAQLADKANKAQEAWITPTLLNGWTSPEGLQYRKNQFGQLEFKGWISPSTKTNDTFMTLPLGYKPLSVRYVNFGGNAYVAFLTNGSVQSYFASWISLDNITISLE